MPEKGHTSNILRTKREARAIRISNKMEKISLDYLPSVSEKEI